MASNSTNYETILHALAVGDIDHVRLLLKEGARLNLKEAIRVVISSGQCEALRFLIREYKIDVDKNFLLHQALIAGQEDIARWLVVSGADVNKPWVKKYAVLRHFPLHLSNPNSMTIGLDSMTYDGFTTTLLAVRFAIKRGNTQKLQLLLQHGAQIEARTYDGNTGLLLACKKSVPADCVRILLEHGAFPNVKNWYQQMPLTLARVRNDEEKIRLLQQHGATEEERSDQDETALMSACQNTGDVESVKHLLENSASPNLKNRRGETALHYAARADVVETLKVLVQYKSDVNSMDDNGVTPLMKACEEVSVGVECVRFLLENNALPNLTDICGKAAIHYTSRSGNVQKLQLLVQHGANVNAVDEYRETPLMWACREVSVDVDYVECLLINEALPNLTSIYRETALDSATKSKDLQKVKVLIEYKADVNIMRDDRKTHWVETCFSDYVDRDCVKFLIEKSPLPRLADSAGWTYLHWASLTGDEEMIDLLVQNQANVNAKTDDGKTSLMLACDSDFVGAKCVRSLLDRGALPNLTNEDNETAFDFAMKSRESVEKVRLLIDHGANVDYNTKFLNAARNNNRKFLELFHERGADISAEDSSGQNAIMLAIKGSSQFGDTATVQWLVDKGVSVNQRDKNGWTPLMAAVDCENTEIVKLLLEAGADVHAIKTVTNDSGTNETTALVQVFDKYRISKNDCAELLIRAGAINSLSRRHNNVLHFMVKHDNCKMIFLLLTHGMAPTLCREPFRFSLSLYTGRVDPVSPLTLALEGGKFRIVQYLTDNMVLYPSDCYGHLYHNELRARLKSFHIIEHMDAFYNHPRSLSQLCCVTISYIVGGVPGRVDRINSLPVPEKVKDHLLLKDIRHYEHYTSDDVDSDEHCISDDVDVDDSDQDSLEEYSSGSSDSEIYSW